MTNNFDRFLQSQAFQTISVERPVQDMTNIHIQKRLDIFGENKLMETLGGKGNFIDGGRYYLANGWNKKNIYAFDVENDYSYELFMSNQADLKRGDDLVIGDHGNKAYSACYSNRADSYVAVTDVASRKVIKSVKTGSGTCGLTMSNNERYVVASNDMDDSISIIDTQTDDVVSTLKARTGFEQIGMTGYIQGISIAQDDGIFVYGCSGSGAIVKFEDILGEGRWTISWPGGKLAGISRTTG